MIPPVRPKGVRMKFRLFSSPVAVAGAMLASWIASSSVQAGPNIVGGVAVEANDPLARSTVALYLVDGNGRAAICTGSLINQSTVVTAAHCVQGVKQAAVVFARDVRRLDRIPKNRIRPVVGATANPNYHPDDGMFYWNDIAVIRFQGGIPSGYEPATVMEKRASEIAVQPGAKVVIAGYGITAAEADNSGQLRKTTMFVRMVTKNQSEVGLVNAGHSACQGDSGGPAFVQVNGRYLLWGVTSRGDKYCSLSIYTKIQAYLKNTSASYSAR